MRRPNHRSNRGTPILIFWRRVSIHLLFSPTFHCTQRNKGWFLGNCHTEWPSETGFAGLRDKLAIMSNSPYSERPAACTLQKTLKTKTEIHINVEGWGWWKLKWWLKVLRRLRGAGVVMKVVIDFFVSLASWWCWEFMVLMTALVISRWRQNTLSISPDVKCCREVIHAHDIDPIFSTHRDIRSSDVNIWIMCRN